MAYNLGIYDNLLQHGVEFSDKTVRSLRMVGTNFPVSITEREFDFISKIVKENNCSSGYELATAFGISSIAIAIGMQSNPEANLISVDAYIEEFDKSPYSYRGKAKEDVSRHENPMGLQTAQNLRDNLGLQNIIKYHIGFSPSDIGNIIGNNKLDVVFIDAAHFDENIIMDLTAIENNFKPGCILLMHDAMCFGEVTINKIKSLGFNNIPTGIADNEGYQLRYYKLNR